MLDEIIQDVEFLKRNNNTNDLVGKLQAVERLAINSYYLAGLVGDAYETKNSTEFFYKSAMHTEMAMSQGPVGKAEWLARDKYKELYKDSLDADSKYRKLSLLMSQTNTLIEQVRQTCSFLKQEYRNNNA